MPSWHSIRDLAPIAMNPAAETLFGVSHLNEAAVGALLRNNEWLLRMVEICLTSGQILADAEAKLSLGTRVATVSAEVAPLLAAEGSRHGAVVLLHDHAFHRGAVQALGAESDLKLSPAGLAHEVKNPLTGIKGAAELLARTPALRPARAAVLRAHPGGRQPYHGAGRAGAGREFSAAPQLRAGQYSSRTTPGAQDGRDCIRIPQTA